MGDINVTNIPPVTVAEIDNIAPVTIAAVQQIDRIAPVAVHIKELNQIDPLQIDSLRIDRVRHIDPLSVERLDVTRLPVVNLSVNQVPAVDVSVRRMPPVSVGIHQEFDLPSNYTARARLFGFEILRLRLQGCTRVIPRDRVRREQAHVHERSFVDVAAVGNPAIPSRLEERSAVAITGGATPPRSRVPPLPPAAPPDAMRPGVRFGS
jgi:hypothetical protein